jgi:hypothetical protein
MSVKWQMEVPYLLSIFYSKYYMKYCTTNTSVIGRKDQHSGLCYLLFIQLLECTHPHAHQHIRTSMRVNYRRIVNTVQCDLFFRYCLYMFRPADHLQKAEDQHVQKLLLQSS